MKKLKPREEVAYLRPAPGCWVRPGCPGVCRWEEQRWRRGYVLGP